MADVIDAWCIACPDGQTRWCKDDPKDAATTWAQWRNGLPAAQREAYEQAGVLGGIVKIRMLRADFDRLTSGVTEPVGINGLTEAETSATASVFGLTNATVKLPEPSRAQLAQWALEAIEAGSNAAIVMNLEGLKQHLRRATAAGVKASDPQP
jgi:hypothetical protein